MNFIFKLPQKNVLWKLLLTGVFLFVAIDSFYVLFSSHLLRPSADDYCFGRLAQSGVFGGTLRWWNTWTGNFSSAFIQNLLVGIPLAFFPWKYVSSISFISASLILACLVFVIGYKKLNLHFLLGLSLSTPFIWWTFLWAPRVFEKSQTYPFANALTHWQTVNVGSVFCLSLILIGIFILPRLQPGNIKINIFLTSFLGLFTGLCGEPINLIAIIMAITFSVNAYLVSSTRLFFSTYSYLNYAFFTLIGLLISHQSPGYLFRLSRINPDLSLSANRVVELIFWTIPTTITNLFGQYFNIGSIFVLLIVIGISFIFYKNSRNSSPLNLRIELFTTFWFAIVFSLVSRLLEAFSYFGYWHQIPSFVCVFLSLVLIGVYIGRYLSIVIINPFSILVVLILFGAVLIGGMSSIYLVKSMRDRHTVWQHKAADLEGISDTNDPNGWIMGCWREVAKFRGDAPSRGQ